MDNNGDFSRLDELLNDPLFIEWINHPNEQLDEHWQEWQQQDPANATLLEQAVLLVRGLTPANPPVPEAFYQQLQSRIDTTIRAQQPARVRRLFTPARSIAAILIGLALAGLLYFLLPGKQMIITTPYAQTKTVWLPDSSAVTLNANTTLEYSPSGFRNNRKVTLTGEAFFNVRHIDRQDGQRIPFVVQTKDLKVEVLGTTFNVKDIHNASVVLQSGKVQVTIPKAQQTLLMQPGELVRFVKEQGITERKKVSADLYTAWMKGLYVFENTTLETVCHHLEDYFGTPYKIEVASLKTVKFSGTIELANEETVIRTLANLLQTSVRKQNNTIIIGPGSN
jgi:ferric-dicitrate binding protein FerR (iron transport regulator)